MIFDAARLPHPLTVRADLCVIGSGAGGAAAATVAAEAGLRVVLLEAGEAVLPGQMNQREEDMLPRLLVANGGQTTADRGVQILQGRALGGSTIHNINLCKRIPTSLLAEWARDRRLAHLPVAAWAALYDEVEALLEVSVVPRERWNRHNLLLERGLHALGWAGGGLAHNRTGCVGSGFCLVGCAYDAKNNALKVLVPRAVGAGAQILTRCRAVTIDHDGRAVRGVDAVALDPVTRAPIGRVRIDAPRVCVSASATGTPALLRRSRVPAPDGAVGDTLRVHPALVAAGEFDEPVRAWEGIPQTIECTEFLDLEAAHAPGGAERVGLRTWIVPAFAHPVGTATLMPGAGAAHRALMSRYAHLGVLTAMIHDLTPGRVRPRGQGVRIDLWPNAADRRELVFGLVQCVRLLFAAGARRVHVPFDPPWTFAPGDSLERLERLALRRGMLDITAVHPMSSVPMGDDPAVAAVDSQGRHHRVRGLWVADGSLFPTSIGAPPQLSIYALGLHVGRAIARA